jgi:hypothetical protein
VTSAAGRLQLVEVAIDELRPDPANPRKIVVAEIARHEDPLEPDVRGWLQEAQNLAKANLGV